MTSTTSGGRPSAARARLLATASQVFYAEGIHAVGVDRIIAAARVTRATMYRHFPGKEDLVLAYLTEADIALRSRLDAAVAAGQPVTATLRAVAGQIAADIRSPGFRGCVFLNAVTEYPDPAHPAHRAVLSHRQWFLDTVTGLLAQVPVASAEPAGRHFVMLRDGAMAAGCLVDPVLVGETFLNGIDGILRG